MGARIPIVFISGHGDIAMAVKAVKDGAVDFVQKPYREQQLLDAIDEALRRDASVRNRPATEGSRRLDKRDRRVDAARARGDAAGAQGLAEQGHRQGPGHQLSHRGAAPKPAAREAGREFDHRADAASFRTIARLAGSGAADHVRGGTWQPGWICRTAASTMNVPSRRACTELAQGIVPKPWKTLSRQRGPSIHSPRETQ